MCCQVSRDDVPNSLLPYVVFASERGDGDTLPAMSISYRDDKTV